MNKIKIIILGATGKMGQTLIKLISESSSMELCGAHEVIDNPYLGEDAGFFMGVNTGIFIKNNMLDAMKDADVLIDFTRPEGTLRSLSDVVNNKIPCVIGTTGFNDEEINTIKKASETIPICLAPNMSVGINVLIALIEQASRQLSDYDFEVIESHHKHKVDAPSGTAIRLGQAVSDGLKINLDEYAVYSRHGRDEKRKKNEIGFSTIRAGDIVGEHTVMIAGEGERIELTHKATSRSNFAYGALKAANFLVNQEPGLFDMQDVLKLKKINK